MGLAMAKHPLRPGYALLVCDVDAGNAGKGAARRPDDRPCRRFAVLTKAPI
jgi:hypothetical protein